MAILSQVRLAQLTGSLRTGGDVGLAVVSATTKIDSLAFTDLSGILQEFANASAKVSGRLNWTEAVDGQLAVSDAGNYRSMRIDGKGAGGNKRWITIGNTGSIRIAQVGDGTEMVSIKTGDSLLQAGGNIEIEAEKQLVLSSSHVTADAILIDSLGGLVAKTARTTNAFIISASIGHAGDEALATNPRIDIVAKGGIRMYSSGSGASLIKYGELGPQPGVRTFRLASEGLPGTTMKVIAENAGDLQLSGTNCVYLGDNESGAATGLTGTQGMLKLSNTGEFATFVTNFTNSTTLIGAINSVKSSVSSAEPTLWKNALTASLGAFQRITLAKDSGDDGNLANYKTNAVYAYLNGQLLISGTGGGIGPTGPADGDYALVGNGTTNEIAFSFALEPDDQVRVINHA